MALDQVTVEYNANIGKLQSDLAGAEAAFRKTDQAATQSAGKITSAFQKTGGIVENLNAHLKSLEARRDKAMNPASIALFNKRIDETRGKIQALTATVDKSGQSIAASFKNIAASVGIAFGVQQVLQFGKQLVNLALKAEEVKTAFGQLNNTEILDKVRDAVSGTVDDVTLMQSILKAESFNIPLDHLATLFEFAERKAGALGLTTEETFQTIIQGIGARSPRAFTSLGISVDVVRSKLEGMNFETSSIADVSQGMSDIFRSELAAMGPPIDSNSDKVARLNAQWTNFKTKAGQGLLGVFSSLSTAITGVVDVGGDIIGLFTNIGDVFSSAGDSAASMGQDFRDLNLIVNPLTKDMIALEQSISRLSETEQKLIKETNGITEAWKKYHPEGTLTGVINRDLVESIESLKAKQSELNTELESSVSRKRRAEINRELLILDDKITIALGKQTDAQKKLSEEQKKGIEQAEALMLSMNKRVNELLGAIGEDKILFAFGRLKGALDDLQQESQDTEIDPLLPERGMEKLHEQLAQRKKLMQDSLKGRIQILENERDTELKIAEELGQSKLLVEQKYERLIQAERTKAAVETIASLSEIYNSINAIISEVNDNRLKQELDLIESQRKGQLDSLDKQLENEKLTDKQRTALLKQREAIEEASNKRIELAREEAAKEQLKFTIAGIILNQASAIGAAISGAVAQNFGNPIGIAATLAIVLPLILSGFAQALAAANSVQLAEGEVDLRGPGTKKSDSIPARLSRGESVITADGTTLDPDLLRAMNRGESEFLKHIQVNYVWPYMEQVIKAHSKAESKGLNFTDKNLLKELRTGNKLQIKTTQAMIAAMQRSKSYLGERN